MLQVRKPIPMTDTTTYRTVTPDLGGVSTSPLAALETLGSSVQIKRGQEVYSEGDAAEYCYRVVEGCIRTVKLLADGSRQVGEILLPGDFFGFEFAGAHFFSAQAVTPVVLRRYPRRSVMARAEADSALAGQLHALTARALQAARQQMVRLTRKSAADRIASFLLEMADRSSSSDAYVHLPMSRSDIADYLGLVIETVSRTITQFKQRKLIAMKDTNHIKILDREALEDIEDDN